MEIWRLQQQPDYERHPRNLDCPPESGMLEYELAKYYKEIALHTAALFTGLIFSICLSASAKDRFGSPELKIPSNAQKLNITFADAELWTGKQVPRTMQCPRLGGQTPSSPSLLVSGLSDKVKTLVVFYANPRAFDNHGLVRVTEGREGVNWPVPAIKSQASIEELPRGVEMYDGGNMVGKAYSSPCPSGGSWSYAITVYALDENDSVIGVGEKGMGYAP